ANERRDEIGAGRAREGEADGVAVEHQSAPGAEPGEVEVPGAEEPHFLADGEHDVERRMAEAALPAGAHALADDGDPRLVVAAEHRGAVAADHIVLDDGSDADARLDRVHVRAEEERRRVHGAGHVRDQVSRLTDDLGAGAVEAHLAAAGSTVTLLGRRDHMDAVRARGLVIDGLFGTHRVSGLECATAEGELGGPYRAIFLTVKAYDAAGMLDTVTPFLDRDGVLVCM